MNQKIQINNNCFFINIEDNTNSKLLDDCVDITSCSVFNVQSPILLKVDFSNLSTSKYKSVLRRLFKVKKMGHIKIGIKQDDATFLGFFINYHDSNKQHHDFLNALNSIFYTSLYDMYNYIYDVACNLLDEQFIQKNLCDFKYDQCIEKRLTKSNSQIGCCHHYEHQFLAPLIPNNKLIPCQYLIDKKCTAKCISCKLFTCDTLKRNGIKFRIKDILILDTFFNIYQKYIIKFSTFTSKDEILKKLLVFRNY